MAVLLGSLALAGGQAVPQQTAHVEPLMQTGDGGDGKIKFYEQRVRQDPEDFVADNALAGSYLRKVRETGDIQYLDLANRAAKASLASVPAIRNSGGVAALAQAELASHSFTAARDHVQQLIELDPQPYSYGLLADTLLELGDYAGAGAAVKQMEVRQRGQTESSEIRQARLSFLHGDLSGAQEHLSNALIFLKAHPAAPKETIAWCQWQMGELAFVRGSYADAEDSYRSSLGSFPGYFRALAGLAKAQAAQGNIVGSADNYKHAIKRFPDPTFVAALGDLYKIRGNEHDAAAQFSLVEYIGHLSALSGVLYNRQLANYYADHEINAEAAYEQAKQEYTTRRDIYGSDTLAWAALKAGKISEAQSAIEQSLQLGTQDPRLLYHAGMIARAAGNKTAAASYLRKAQKLSPEFDPFQATRLRQALKSLEQ
ncbi:MAG: tetratricopeptide repeat protein [Acidobacteriales bacterium]|nr:tetratricopeptide repeat protein [Terriglobales bacterium]